MGLGRTVGSLIVKLGFDAKEVDQGLKKFERNLKTSARNMESIGRTMSIGFTAPFLLGMRQAIKAYDEEAKAVKKLEVALGGTSKALLAQAAAIQKTTVYADDAVIGVQAWAAALGHGEAEIGKMTSAAVGLESGLGIGLDQAMSMLHKSTLGASKGLGQLVPGVKELTKEQLKSGAAIDLVNQKFAGYAEAMASTGTGALEKFKNRFGDLMEQFGEAAFPLLDKIIDKFSALTDWFSKLSPETKKMVVEVGAFVALAGPVLLMSANVLKLAMSFNTLAGSISKVTMLKAGLIATLSAGIGVGANAMIGDREKYEKDLAARSRQAYLSGDKNEIMKVQMAANSTAALDLLGGLNFGDASRVQAIGRGEGLQGGTNRGGGLSGAPWLAKDKKGLADGLGDGSGVTGQIYVAGQGIARALQHVTTMLTPNRGGGGIGSIAPNTNPAIAGAMGGGALTPLAGVGGHGEAIAGMMGIMPDMTANMDGQLASVEALNEGYMMLGSSIASVMTGMASSMEEGTNAFAAFGKAALMAAAQVAKAALVESLASATKKGAAVAGAPGIIIGATLGLAAISIVEGMIGKMKMPKLAQGGATAGPAIAMIGDNPSGKEMVMPWEKTGDFAARIASQMGGGGGALELRIKGDDLIYAVSRAQNRGQRRGSSNVITF